MTESLPSVGISTFCATPQRTRQALPRKSAQLSNECCLLRLISWIVALSQTQDPRNHTNRHVFRTFSVSNGLIPFVIIFAWSSGAETSDSNSFSSRSSLLCSSPHRLRFAKFKVLTNRIRCMFEHVKSSVERGLSLIFLNFKAPITALMRFTSISPIFSPESMRAVRIWSAAERSLTRQSNISMRILTLCFVNILRPVNL